MIPNPSLMAYGHHKAVGGHYEHLNFSVKWRGGSPGNFGAYEDTKETAHHAFYGESCWETLARGEPSKWPFSDRFRRWCIINPRTFYPELAAAAPVGYTLPKVDFNTFKHLPESEWPSREALNIIWMAEPVIQIVLDRSGSMDGTPLANVKAAAQNLIDVVEDGMSVGVLAFDDTVSTIASIVEITNKNVRADLKAAIGGITVGGSTAVGDAMQEALDGLQAYGISNRAAAVFLLSDGSSNVGPDPMDIVPAYQVAHIPIFGFGYGVVDPQLEAAALNTGGKYYTAPVSYNAIKKAFVEANAFFVNRAIVLNGNTDPTVAVPGGRAATEPVHIPFLVDSSMTGMRLSIVYEGPGVSEVSLGLMAPDSTLLTVAPEEAPDGSVLMDFHVDSPDAGEWAIVGTRPADTHLSYLADARADGGYSLEWLALEQPDFESEYLTVVSLSGSEGAIDGAHVTGDIRFDNGEIVSCVFSNFAGGLYGVLNTATHAGHGTMTVTAGNPHGAAAFTWRDAQVDWIDAGEEEGEAEVPEDEPITENFMRVITGRIFVEPCLFRYVDAGRPDDSGDGLTWETAFQCIQTAIDAVENYAVITVTNGTYAPFAVAGDRWLTIRSVEGAAHTIIDGGGTARCATLGSSHTHTAAALTGFTLTNGWATHGGGAQYGTLDGCVLTGNTAQYYGGGAYYGVLNNCVLSGNQAALHDGGGACDSILDNCVLTGNTAMGGGGGGSVNGALSNCILSGNTAGYYGGGAYYGVLNNCVLSGNMVSGWGGGAMNGWLCNCALTGNEAVYGGGAFASTLYGSTLTGNTAAYGGGVFGLEDFYSVLINCIVWGNTSGDSATGNFSDDCYLNYSCTTPMPVGGAGNIAQDPLFADAAAGDFRLQVGSPCINAGNNATDVGDVDLDGKPRIRDGTVDMGAYEYASLRPAQDVPVPVAFDWLDLYLGWQGITDYADLARAQGLNGYLFWESHVAGLNPTDASSKFRITNFAAAGDAVTALDWIPRRSDRVYTVIGKTNLMDEVWHSPTNEGMRFFRVQVELP
ncbi:MAG: VWA domain-containing protein [Kiritimatiellaeota bacterium]|nr:VWA domain-containing protein [Kiritimatiellota bacterium]